MKKIIIISVPVMLLLAIIAYAVCPLFVMPSKDSYLLSVKELPYNVVAGNEVSVSASLKSQNFLSYYIKTGPSMFSITVKQKDEEKEVWSKSIATHKIFWGFSVIEKTSEFSLTQKGDYVITVTASFSVISIFNDAADYEYTKTFNVSVI